MKKFLVLFSLIISLATVKAQTLVVTTPTSSLQSFSTTYVTGFDSLAVAAAATGITIPSGYQTLQVYLNLAYAAGKYTGAITLPTNPVVGQSVDIVSNKSFLYHLFTTVPAFLKVDTSGTHRTKLVYNGTYWEMIN